MQSTHASESYTTRTCYKTRYSAFWRQKRAHFPQERAC